jgi:membrane protease YdiL (CAAX protease family)
VSWYPVRVGLLLRFALVDKLPRNHLEPDSRFHRRRVVVGVVLFIGATLLGSSLSVRPGDRSFYLLTGALAATWVVGGFASGPLHLGRIFGDTQRARFATPIAIGVLAAAIFVAGALVVRQIPPLRDYTETVLAHARQGSKPLLLLITVLNGVAEEIFFRGALFAAIGRRYPVPISTAVYALATLATGNPMLVFAATTLGVVLGLQRRASGGVLAPILTHVTWSTIMLFAMPPLFASST